MKNESTLLLAQRLNEINREIDNLEIERLKITKEIKSRYANLKDDVNLQSRTRHKVKVRVIRK
jgi:hypothetical protein